MKPAAGFLKLTCVSRSKKLTSSARENGRDFPSTDGALSRRGFIHAGSLALNTAVGSSQAKPPPETHRLWKMAEKLVSVFNFFIAPQQLPKLARMVKAHPGVNITIDHLSQIDLGKTPEPQMRLLLAMANTATFTSRCPNCRPYPDPVSIRFQMPTRMSNEFTKRSGLTVCCLGLGIREPVGSKTETGNKFFGKQEFQHRLDLVVLKLDDLLLTFIGPANEGGKQNVAGLEQELHGKLGRGQENRPDSKAQCVKSSS
jgi:hypothetical protein